jgi:HlyD family secretion protein/epimerase transport system membrane fusion protein
MTMHQRSANPGKAVASRTYPHTIEYDHSEGARSLRQAIGGPARLGFRLIVLFIAAFGSWSYFAPIDGGAVASGSISPDGSRRTVQHLEGGIISKLLVRDGDTVHAGQVLLVLEDVQPRTAHDALLQENLSLLATRTRLDAEKMGLEEIVFPSVLENAVDDVVRAVVQDQRHVFQTRLDVHRSRKRVLEQRIAQLHEQITGFEAQVHSATRQLAIIAEEVKGKSHLLKLNLMTKPEVLKLDRAEAEILGRRGEYTAAIGRAREQIGEAELQLLAVEAERSEQIATQLDQVRIKLSENTQNLDAGRDVLARIAVTAPVDGIVLNMKFKTEGGVVQRGEPILEIVPANENLLIDAKLSPNDIDVVRAGLPAFVHLTAYNSRLTPKVQGSVKLVSADRLVDEVSKQPYFLARVEVLKDELEQLATEIELLPGMPAEVMIVTDRRSLFEYLLRPFLDTWRRSFRQA